MGRAGASADRDAGVGRDAGFRTVGDLYDACKFRAALGECLALAREAKVYLDRKVPWTKGGSAGSA